MKTNTQRWASERVMAQVPFCKTNLDPRRANNFLDSCAFDPKYAPESDAAEEIRRIADDPGLSLLVTCSNRKEIEHPNTPADVKREARALNYTIENHITHAELTRKAAVLRVLTGNGNPENYAADAAHLFEAGRYFGYFITTDRHILDKRNELRDVCPATVVKPSEWLHIYHEADAEL